MGRHPRRAPGVRGLKLRAPGPPGLARAAPIVASNARLTATGSDAGTHHAARLEQVRYARTEGGGRGHRPHGVAVTQHVDEVGRGDRRADRARNERGIGVCADARRRPGAPSPSPASRSNEPCRRRHSASERGTGAPRATIDGPTELACQGREQFEQDPRAWRPLTCRGRRRVRDRRGPTRPDRRRRRRRSVSSRAWSRGAAEPRASSGVPVLEESHRSRRPTAMQGSRGSTRETRPAVLDRPQGQRPGAAGDDWQARPRRPRGTRARTPRPAAPLPTVAAAGSANTAEVRYNSCNSRSSTQPVNRTRPSIPTPAASRSSRRRSPPAPTTTSSASG